MLVDSSEENHPLYADDERQPSNIEVISGENGNLKQKVNENSENDIENLEKDLLITKPEANGSNQLPNQQRKSPRTIKHNNFSNARDLKAMSMASIYDKENQEMNEADM